MIYTHQPAVSTNSIKFAWCESFWVATSLIRLLGLHTKLWARAKWRCRMCWQLSWQTFPLLRIKQLTERKIFIWLIHPQKASIHYRLSKETKGPLESRELPCQQISAFAAISAYEYGINGPRHLRAVKARDDELVINTIPINWLLLRDN